MLLVRPKRFAIPNRPELATSDQIEAAVIRDTLWLDGGSLYWTPTYGDGSTGYPTTLGESILASLAIKF